MGGGDNAYMVPKDPSMSRVKCRRRLNDLSSIMKNLSNLLDNLIQRIKSLIECTHQLHLNEMCWDSRTPTVQLK